MSRPIKLRAWTGDKFIYLEIAHGGQGKGGIKLDPGVYGHLEPWQQFTGLTDKNGTEIYEGDIVVFESDYPGGMGEPPEPNNDLGVVKMEEGAWGADPQPWKYNREKNFRQFAYDHAAGDMEVIGNIHENPELLEEHHG